MLGKTSYCYSFFLLLSILCLSISGCISTVFTGANTIYHHRQLENSASNYYITLQIQHQFSTDVELHRQTNINVTCFNQIVLLTGQAPNTELINRAVNYARNTPNVLRVVNAITVDTPSTAGDMTKDTWITTKIKSKMIASNDIDPDKIKVITEKQVVYLMGVVPKEQADLATDIARNTAGVKRVVTIFYYVIMPKID